MEQVSFIVATNKNNTSFMIYTKINSVKNTYKSNI